MPNKDLTDITFIIDRSGSMGSCRSDAEGGINEFIRKQREMDGKANLTIIQFDTDYEIVCNGKDINEVADYVLSPRGCTALLDAVGTGIVQAKERIKAMNKKDRPGLVIVVIVTDGHENASKEYTLEQVKQLIEKRKSKDWQFTFLGASDDAFDQAGGIGIARDAVAKYGHRTAKQMMGAVSANVGRMRSARACDMAVMSNYTDEERKSMDEE